MKGTSCSKTKTELQMQMQIQFIYMFVEDVAYSLDVSNYPGFLEINGRPWVIL